MADEQIKGIFTTKGREQIAQALEGGYTITIGSMVYGDGRSPDTPNVSQTSLIHQLGSITAIAKVEDEVWTYFEGVIPADAPDMVIREIGITNSDGDLILVVSVPDINKTTPVNGISQRLPIRIGVTVSDGQVLTVMPDPDNILPFTQQTLGLIKGRKADGYVAALDGNSGYGKVFGWEKVLKSVSEYPQGVNSDFIFDKESKLSYVSTDNYFAYIKSDNTLFYAERPIQIGDIVYSNNTLTTPYGFVYAVDDTQVVINGVQTKTYSFVKFNTGGIDDPYVYYQYEVDGIDVYTPNAIASNVVLYTDKGFTQNYGTVVRVDSENSLTIGLNNNFIYSGTYSIDTLNLAHIETNENDTVLKVGNTSSVLQLATNMSEDEEINNHIIVDTFDEDGNPTQKTIMYMEDVTNTLPYTFNSGNVDSSGNADLIAYSGADVTYKVGSTYPNLTGTLANSQQFEVESITADDVSALADGSYVKYIGSDDTTDLLKNKITVAKVEPSTPSDNDVWINNAISPLSVKKYVAPNYTNNDATISNDGIASGFSNTKFVTANVNFPSNTTSIEFYFPAITLNAGYSSFTVPLQAATNNINIALGINNNSHTALYLWGDNNTTIVAGGTGSLTYTTGTKYYLRLVWNGTSYKLERSTDNINWETDYTLTSSVPLGAVSGYVLGNNVTLASAFNGSLDLKEFKVIVDNNLLYQLDIGSWVDYDKVPLGKITVTSGAVTDVETLPYNINYVGSGLGYSMPSNRYISLTLPPSGQTIEQPYKAPANGFFYFSSDNGVLQTGNNVAQSLGMTSTPLLGSEALGAKVFVPVYKGQTIFISCRSNSVASPTIKNGYFIYSCDSRGEYYTSADTEVS